MDRRTYLAALGAGMAGAAGCMQPAKSGTTTPSPTTTERTRVRIETVTMNLEVPWGAAFHPETGDLYVTERPGRIRRLVRDENGNYRRETRKPLADLTDRIRPSGEGGLLGLVFHPTDPGLAYTYGTYSGDGGLANRIVRHDVEDGFSNDEVVLDGIPASSIHNGGRLEVGPDGALFATTGDASESDLAQRKDSLAGKVLRLTADGEPHPDNPFGNAVYTYGHRNPQGLAFHPETGDLYGIEHGPDHDDEINVLRAGENYGWPTVMGRGGPGVAPIATYTPTIAPSGGAFYAGPVEDWRGDLFFATLKAQHLHRVGIDPQKREVTGQSVRFESEYGRLRTVFTGPDGDLFVTTSNRDGRGSPAPQDDRILRIRPV